MSLRSRLLRLHTALYARYGPQDWWLAEHLLAGGDAVLPAIPLTPYSLAA